jgi:hypothetical protein
VGSRRFLPTHRRCRSARENIGHPGTVWLRCRVALQRPAQAACGQASVPKRNVVDEHIGMSRSLPLQHRPKPDHLRVRSGGGSVRRGRLSR